MERSLECAVCASSNLKERLDCTHDYYVDGEQRTYKYAFIECNSCQLGFLNPIPGIEVMPSLYNEDYACYSLQYDPKAEASSFKYRIAADKYKFYFNKTFGNFFKSSIASTVELILGKTITFTLSIPLSLNKESQILDLGYGSGNWLLSMKAAGFVNMSGYDIDDNALYSDKLNEAGIQTYSGNFIEADFNDRFDCIRLEHVFEHLTDPKAVLQRCFDLLNPGGTLVMTYPGVNSISRSISLENAHDLDIPRHIFHHSKRSARLILEDAGFQVMKIKELGNSGVFYYSIKNVWKKYSGVTTILQILIMNPVFQSFYNLLCLTVGKGEFASVYCKKPIKE